MTPDMKITIIHPCMGRRPGERYIKSWQMESLPAAALAGASKGLASIRFFDDRMEEIDYDAPTDLAAISIETYTAKRAYQVASEYRKRGVPVVMGGFHASLCPDEVSRYAETVVVGEAEGVWPQVIQDYRSGTPKRRYDGDGASCLKEVKYDRSIFDGKKYLPIRLIETGRGCQFRCEFCAIQSFFKGAHRRRSVDSVIEEIKELRDKTKVFFFVDDNFASDLEAAKELLRALVPLRVRWITQLSIHAAHDEEFLELLNASGCEGVLIGFESTDPETIHMMNKGFALGQSGPRQALHNLKKHRVRVYGTFVFGYDNDTPESFRSALDFATEHGFYIAAFNHLTPFPGTPLYDRLVKEGRMTFDKWWIDSRYDYNTVPFSPRKMTAEDIRQNCISARKEFYSLQGMLKRIIAPANWDSGFMLRNFLPINWLHRREVSVRDKFPLGDAGWNGQLIEVR